MVLCLFWARDGWLKDRPFLLVKWSAGAAGFFWTCRGGYGRTQGLCFGSTVANGPDTRLDNSKDLWRREGTITTERRKKQASLSISLNRNVLGRGGN
jgi:hypothetical protein